MVASYGTNGFTAIQFSDIHQNQRGELDIIAQFIKDNSIDYGFFCGDAVGENRNLKNGVGLEHELLNVANNHTSFPDLDDKVEDTIKEAYNQIAPNFQAIKDALSQDLFGVLGNHDFTPAYNILNAVTWLDRPTDDPILITLANGKTLAIGGNQNTNTYEIPGYQQNEYNSISTHLQKHFIDYELGHDSDQYALELIGIQRFHADPMQLLFDKPEIYHKVKALSNAGTLAAHEASLNHRLASLQTKENSERTRLEAKLKGSDASIFLTHKIAGGIYGSGKITKEVTNYNNIQSTHGGHMHAGEMTIEGHTVSISDVLALLHQDQAAIQRAESRRGGQQGLQKAASLLSGRVTTEQIDGVETFVIYIGDAIPQLNAGADRFIVHKYDDNATWEFCDVINYQ
jgi:predicted phosphodiesterase